MLLSIRKKSQGWLAWVIVIIIAVPFALFGINSYFEGTNQIVVANVNGNKINAQELESAMEQRRRTLRSQLGANYAPQLVDNSFVRRQVVEDIVSQRLMQQYAQDQGLSLSDDALRQRITQMPDFQTEGEFNAETYQRLLGVSGYSIESFENQQRISGGIDQLRQGLQDSALINPHELDKILALRLQQRDADYSLIAANAMAQDVTISNEELQDYYQTHESEFLQKDQLKLNYVVLSIDNIMADIELDEDEIKQAYEASLGLYTTPETRQASHILFAIPRSADANKSEEIHTLAKDVLSRLHEGEDFSQLAAEFSDDPGSKRNGGELGVIAKGQMVSEFEDVVFSMKQGQLSSPIKTEFGYHIIKLTELSHSKQKPFSDVKEQVAQAEQKRLAQTQFIETAETFRTLVFENPDSLTIAAEDLGLTMQTSGWISLASGADDFNNPRVRVAAFDDAVVEDDLNSEVIELDNNRLLAMHKLEFKAAYIKSFEEVSEQISTQINLQKSTALAQQRGEKLTNSINASENNDDIEFIKLPALKQDTSQPNEIEIADYVFKQNLDGTKSHIGGMVLANGDYAVIRLKSITPGDPTKASDTERIQTLNQLRNRSGNAANVIFSQSLRARSKVEIFSATLQDNNDISDTSG